MKRGLTTFGIGLTLTSLAACGLGEARPPSASRPTFQVPADPYEIAPADRTYISEEFKKDTTYLTHLGRIVTGTGLLLLSDNDVYSCTEPGGQKIANMSTMSPSEYCPSTNTVVLTAGDINTARYVGKYHLQISFLEAHELGHDEQKKEGELTPASLTMPEHSYIEEQATCYAGETMEYIDPTDVTGVEQLLKGTPMDTAHGTSQAQAFAFMTGATTGACKLGPY